MKKQFSLKTLVLVALGSITLSLGFAARWDWISPIRAQKQETIFEGTTPKSFADLASHVQSAVVNISTSKNIPARRGYFYEFHENYVERYGQPNGNIKKQNSLGSGFILNKEGYILTNNHVIQGADEILVKLSDGRSFKAQVIGSDPQSDIAVIKIDSHESLPTVQLGDSDALQVGDWVVAIGNPFGLTQTVTAGILSAKGRVIGAGPYDDFLQTDASINPGNSGGPLFNIQGEVIGVNTAIVEGGQGIGFAIPINIAKSIIPQLIKSGKVQRGYLGIALQEVTPELAKSLGMVKAEGVLVGVVYQDTPAEKSGIKAGDIITKFNGKSILREQDLPIYVSQAEIGSNAEIEVYRNGQYQKLTVQLAPIEPVANDSSKKPSYNNSNRLGLVVQDLNDSERQAQKIPANVGIRVLNVLPQSPAEILGLKPGDLILELNGQGVKAAADFQKLSQQLQSNSMAKIVVKRGTTTSYLTFTL